MVAEAVNLNAEWAQASKAPSLLVVEDLRCARGLFFDHLGFAKLVPALSNDSIERHVRRECGRDVYVGVYRFPRAFWNACVAVDTIVWVYEELIG